MMKPPGDRRRRQYVEAGAARPIVHHRCAARQVPVVGGRRRWSSCWTWTTRLAADGMNGDAVARLLRAIARGGQKSISGGDVHRRYGFPHRSLWLPESGPTPNLDPLSPLDPTPTRDPLTPTRLPDSGGNNPRATANRRVAADRLLGVGKRLRRHHGIKVGRALPLKAGPSPAPSGRGSSLSAPPTPRNGYPSWIPNSWFCAISGRFCAKAFFALAPPVNFILEVPFPFGSGCGMEAELKFKRELGNGQTAFAARRRRARAGAGIVVRGAGCRLPRGEAARDDPSSSPPASDYVDWRHEPAPAMPSLQNDITLTDDDLDASRSPHPWKQTRTLNAKGHGQSTGVEHTITLSLHAPSGGCSTPCTAP